MLVRRPSSRLGYATAALAMACVSAADLAVGTQTDASVDGNAGAASDPVDAAAEADARLGEPEEAWLPEPGDLTPFYLSQTGLYADIALKQLHPRAVAFEPRFPLWSDGATKRRWLLLPAGERIDSHDPEHWKVPVGTRVFKEFRGEKRLETRLIARTGPGDDDFWMGAFVWNAEETDALFVADGERDVLGSAHDVPEVRLCWTCHRGEPGRLLGVSAVQFPADAPPLLSPPKEAPFVPPGDAVEAAALGYLHGNCGHCHNLNGSARPDTDLDLRLRATDVDPLRTAAYLSTVGVPLQSYGETQQNLLRLVPGEPARSALLLRMQQRGDPSQMPPVASESVDPDGIAIAEAWIAQLAR